MAPFLLLFTTVLVLISVHIMVIDGSRISCTGPQCPSTKCPTSCTCLGDLVDCSRKGLIDIPNDLPVWVHILDLQNNKIGFIDDSPFIHLENLTELDLSSNKIRVVNSSNLQPLTSLQKLTINHNFLTELPDLSYHSSLKELSLHHNEIHTLNSSILEDLPKIQTLDLSFNNLVDLPNNTFGKSSSLLHLSLSHNRLVNIERGIFDNLTSLETLKLSKNKLSTIPKELFRQLNTLQHLEINSNSLTQIEGLSFQGLSSLVTLKLRHSGITYLQDGTFYGLNSIKKLQLDFNNIRKITKGWLYGMNTLQRLYVNNNNISEIEDDAWDSGKRLIELDLSHNKLQSISAKTFHMLYSLKRLILSDNVITYIEEGAFHSLEALQYLELQNNEVSWTIEDTGHIFSGLVRLRFLGLSNNKIKSVVKRAFTGLNRLETLNMTENEISTIEEDSFYDLDHLQNLYINTSSLLCDCQLAWMPTSYQYGMHAHCGYPERLKGKSIYEISPSEMLCGNSPKPVIIKEPTTQTTLKGQNVTLECQSQSSSISEIRIHWRKDGRLLYNTRLRIRNSSRQDGNFTIITSYLQINNIQDEDEGRYQCVISNHFGSVYSNKARITVHVFPVFTKTPVDVSIKTGSTARLECGAKGQPVPEIVWQKDGGIEDFPAARERRLHVIPTDDVFFIVGVKPSDSGVYSCTAVSVAGTIVANATLTVLETPSFVQKMEDKETRAGETAVLECMASGSPKPKLTWMKDGGPLYATERHFFTAENQLLIIVQSQISDSGVYTCEMSNTLGTERGSSHLKILPVNQSGLMGEENHTTTGIVVIVVVICIVGTSIVWVVIIYQTRKRTEEYLSSAPNPPPPSDMVPFSACSSNVCPKDFKKPGRHALVDTYSGHSKDSGTGDSGQQSSDDLLLEDEQGLLLEAHSSSKFGGIPMMGSLIALPEDSNDNRAVAEVYATNNCYLSREQVPLLHTFRTSHMVPGHNRKSLCEYGPTWHTRSSVQYPFFACQSGKPMPEAAPRSFSAEQLGTSNSHCLRHPPREDFPRTESDALDRDSGFSTFPRSITLASVSNWSGDSPRFRRLPKDIPNDSGSFSIAGEEAQELSNRCHSVTVLPIVSSNNCTGVPTSAKT